jgi:hypothetical protein
MCVLGVVILAAAIALPVPGVRLAIALWSQGVGGAALVIRRDGATRHQARPPRLRTAHRTRRIAAFVIAGATPLLNTAR